VSIHGQKRAFFGKKCDLEVQNGQIRGENWHFLTLKSTFSWKLALFWAENYGKFLYQYYEIYSKNSHK